MKQRHRCRHRFCPNHYDDVIGGEGAFGKKKSGAECLPCFYAGQMILSSQTAEEVESAPYLMQAFTEFLEKTGWAWQDVKDSYQRMKGHEIELLM